MIRTLILAALAAGTSVSPVPLVAAPLPQQQDADTSNSPDDADAGTETVLGKEDRYQRMTVPVTIEGKGPFRFMIDTGSQATVITQTLSDKLQLKPVGTATVVGMASAEPVELVQLNGLEFAARVFDNISAPLLEERNVGADGIIGLDSLQDMRVLINFRDYTIAVDQSKSRYSNRGYEIVVRARRKLGRLIITDAMIDGVRTAVIIDTGAQSSVGNIALRDSLRSKNSVAVSAIDIHGNSMAGTQSVARSLKIGAMKLGNVPITFANSPAFDAMGLRDKPVMVLGMASLRLFDRIAIDFAREKVMFDLPSGSESTPA